MAVQLHDTAGPRGVGALDIARVTDIGHDERLLPVADELAPLLTQPGLVPGSVLATQGPGALTLATAFAAEVSRTGGWVAAVGLGRMGVSAVAERGASLDRWAFVDEPGGAAAEVLNALIGNVDVVLLAAGVRLAAAHSRRLRARLRERGTVVIEVAEAKTAGSRGAGAFSPAGSRGAGAWGRRIWRIQPRRDPDGGTCRVDRSWARSWTAAGAPGRGGRDGPRRGVAAAASRPVAARYRRPHQRGPRCH